jgi:metallo-beta-lactamase class B
MTCICTRLSLIQKRLAASRATVWWSYEEKKPSSSILPPVRPARTNSWNGWKKNAIRKTKAVICTHFHVDCVGGLPAFHSKNIPSFAEKRTVELAKANGFHVPNHIFTDSLILSVGNRKVFATFFGEGHTVDNIVGYYPEDRVMFGGCLIKALGAGQGNLEDANVNAWSRTVEKVSKRFPGVQIVIPGHGKYGDRALLDYTVKMFGINKINTEE